MRTPNRRRMCVPIDQRDNNSWVTFRVAASSIERRHSCETIYRCICVEGAGGERGMDILGAERNFASLSVKDLLEARDLYHYHLIHRANVVGTAIGLYLIRKSDTWPTRAKPKPGAAARSYRPRGERTLENSEVRDYSWPCIIVFVDKWVDAERFRGGGQGLPPEDMVPKTLYMPDGRTVPVCVIKVSPAEPASAPVLDVQWPDTFIGGGFPLISESQGTRRMASIGCLVSDGHTVYALTNRHVAGPAGQPILSVLRGAEVEIGASTDRQLTRLPFFSRSTPIFPGRRTWLTLDIGLVALANLRDWTSQVYGLGALGALADLSERNITLRLIGAKIVAYGAISGRLSGQIKALFYRHRSIGGYDDVSDFLIAPAEDGSAQTRPGDSGTLWHLETTDAAQPLAAAGHPVGRPNLHGRPGKRRASTSHWRPASAMCAGC
ncbi:hypothetical protein ACFSKM_01790 [Ancylobacter dichloromethanicus]